MLTKEFAQKVELSEKQVRKIVQHLEERGYRLNKTEYRGREATDFQEEDIELFQDIATKVKQTNSYDLAFEELEKEKDFLQVIVKDDASNLPSEQSEITYLIEELRTEIRNMREERKVLGQMIHQIHQQQNELKGVQGEITSKLEENTETLKAIETSSASHQEAVKNLESTQNNYSETMNQIMTSQKDYADSLKNIESSQKEYMDALKKIEKEQQNQNESFKNIESKQKAQIDSFKRVEDNVKENQKPSNQTSETASSSNVQAATTTSTESNPTKVEVKSDSNNLTEHATEKQVASNNNQQSSQQTSQSHQSQSSPLAEEKPQEKKGFFQRLFGM
ncbi:hypothetical protein [Staphylococcus massiliensis]|uniref:DNA-binding protein n=1 Tax=Staphylococcus massiliensis S46 TaxID=1229783 RepID=K9ALM6_9STAP|nr:hypothetical protein [Staphylococcus massiliensis]EKU48209.1 hypothetical protein C273_05867 [Staphylococcus massiliensis S46]MCG3399529.1 hypothetical protein [Staphylococcus massiliensis]MCG3402038.1 hypothetical protein [Staphylococcus massiliensis]MCG3412711.1 hypothetical protein [Staphylococcus massiliensis]POA00754.1 hypothetical protein CD133_03550 [Staphylococcus massiliensis CCUG 55927]